MSFRIEKPPSNIVYSGSVVDSVTPVGWQIQNNVKDYNFRKSAYGQGKWIVMASSGTDLSGSYITSTDGINWSPVNGGAAFYTGEISPSNYNQYVDVLFANNTWVSVSRQGNTTRAVSSPDGINWTRRDTSGGAPNGTALASTSFNAIAYDQGQFVIVGGNNSTLYTSVSKIFTSTDASDWTGRPIYLQNTQTIDVSATINEWMGVAYGNNTWVALSATTGSTSKKVIISKDSGATWYYDSSTNPATMNNRNWQRVVFGNGLFVAVAADAVQDCIATSPDGINWTLRNAPTSDGGLYSVGFGNGMFIAVSQNGNTNSRTMMSTDGINWTSIYTPTENNFYGVTYANNIWIANSNTGTLNRILRLDPTATTTTYKPYVNLIKKDKYKKI